MLDSKDEIEQSILTDYSIPFQNDTPLKIKILVSLKSSINIVNVLFGLIAV